MVGAEVFSAASQPTRRLAPWWQQWSCFGAGSSAIPSAYVVAEDHDIPPRVVTCKPACDASSAPGASDDAPMAPVTPTPSTPTPPSSEPEQAAEQDYWSKRCDNLDHDQHCTGCHAQQPPSSHAADSYRASTHAAEAGQKAANMANIVTTRRHAKQALSITPTTGTPSPRQQHALLGGKAASLPRQKALLAANSPSPTSSPRLQALLTSSKSLLRNRSISQTGFPHPTPAPPSAAGTSVRSPFGCNSPTSGTSPRASNTSSRDFFSAAAQLIVLSCQLDTAQSGDKRIRSPRTMMEIDQANRRRSLQLENAAAKQRQLRTQVTTLSPGLQQHWAHGAEAPRAQALAAQAARRASGSAHGARDSFASAHSTCRDSGGRGSGGSPHGSSRHEDMSVHQVSLGSTAPSSSQAMVTAPGCAVDEHWLMAADEDSLFLGFQEPEGFEDEGEGCHAPTLPRSMVDDAFAAALRDTAAAMGAAQQLPNSPVLAKGQRSAGARAARWSSLLQHAAVGEHAAHAARAAAQRRRSLSSAPPRPPAAAAAAATHVLMDLGGAAAAADYRLA